MARFVRVSPDLAADGEFDYRLPDAFAGQVSVGSQLRVPFGRTHRRAFVTGFPDESACPPEKLREVEEVLPAPPLFGEDILSLARWIARYYLCSLPAAFRAVLPAAHARDIGLAHPQHVIDGPGPRARAGHAAACHGI